MIEIIGLLRFSVITRNSKDSWELARTFDQATFEAQLFSEERLEKRFALFESVTLPSFDGQSDKRFRLIVLISDKLPKRWKERLRLLANSRKYLELESLGDDATIGEATIRSVQGRIGLNVNNITFRIDDDDAVHKDYIRNVRNAVLAQSESGSIREGDVVTFPKGIYIRNNMGKIQGGIVDYPLIGIGLARMTASASEGTIFSMGNHYKIDKSGVVSLNPSEVFWIRSVYADSDSQMVRDVFKKHVKKENLIEEAELSEIFRTCFPGLRQEDVLKALA